jgi:hypothetical protein
MPAQAGIHDFIYVGKTERFWKIKTSTYSASQSRFPSASA